MRTPAKYVSLVAAASLTVGMLPAAVAAPAEPSSDSTESTDSTDNAGPTAVDTRVRLSLTGTHETEQFDESAAEITSFDPVTQQIFVVNAQKGAIDVLDAANPASPTFVETLTTEGAVAADGSVVPAGAVVNSVKVHGDWIAVATQAPDKVGHGWALFYSTSGDYLGGVRVGSLPDMINVSPDGTTAVVANEGEPADDFSSDPEGTVSIIDVTDVTTLSQDDVRTVGFTAYDEGTELPEGVRVFGPDVPVPAGQQDAGRVARNLEPEFAAIAQDSSVAYVSLQEANAIATIDLETAEVADLWAVPLKDWSLPGNVADFSDRDGEGGGNAINLRNAPVLGLSMPDGIDTYTAGGQQLIITANEGDAREWGDYVEPVRIKDAEYPLCEDVFGGADGVADLKADANLGRLNALSSSGLREGADCFEEIHVMGSRGFSILSTDGEVVFDSAGLVEQTIADLVAVGELPEHAFNANNDATPSFDSRSDDKGPEPEYVTVGEVDGRTFAFLGLERIGGVMTFDVTDPADVRYVDYVNNRAWDVAVDGAYVPGMGDLGAEGVEFVEAQDSPSGQPLVIVANEVSGSTSIFTVEELSVDRLAGAHRYGTAVELSQRFADGSADTVFVSTGQAYPDALVAAALAGHQDAPILLTKSDALPGVTAAELDRLAPSRIVLLGGTGAVSADVESALGAYADEVTRVTGGDRYQTAAALSELFPASNRVYLANGKTFPDALVAGARAGMEGAPVLLTRPESLPGATVAALAAVDPSEVVVLGGTGAVSEDVVTELEASGVDVTRIGGGDRYETAALLADFEAPVARAYVASGQDYPDALTGAATAGALEAPILLTRPDELTSVTGETLADLKPTRILALGGAAAIAEDVLDELEAFLP